MREIPIHQHEYEFTSEAAVLEQVAAELDWPEGGEARLSGVERCSCGAIQRVTWSGPQGGDLERQVDRRIRELREQRESPLGH